MNNLKKIFATLLFLLACNLMIAQNFAGLGDIRISNPINENINIIIDRDFYLTGEEIWFLADYKFEQSDHQISQVIYVELCDNNKSYSRKKFKISDESITSSIDIPRELVSGIYYLRIYTQLQRNNPPEDIKSVMISIINPTIALSEGGLKNEPSIQILPESGILINGLNSKVSFKLNKAMTKRYKSVQLVDQNQQLILEPIIYTNGLGYFEITPVDTLEYALKIIYNDNDSLIIDIDDIKSSGMLVSTSFTKEDLGIKLETNSTEHFGAFKLSIRNQGFNVIHESKLLFVKKEIEEIIDRSLLSLGVNYIFVKNDEGEIVYFKTIYNYPLNYVPLTVKTDKEQYNRRDQISLELQTNLEIDQISQLSVSVVKTGTTMNSDDILPLYFMYNPNVLINYLYQHKKLSKELQDQIDISMLFYSKMVSENNANLFRIGTYESKLNWLPDIRDVSLSGIVRSSISKEPIAGVKVLASVFGKHPQLHLNTTKENGEFVFSFNELEDIQKSFYSINDENANRMELLINSDFSTEYSKVEKIDPAIDTTYQQLIKEMYINAQLLTEFDQLRNETFKNGIDLPYQYGTPDVSILLSDYIETPTLEMVFKEIVTYAKVKERRGQYSLYIYDPVSTEMFTNPLILLDNVPIFNTNELMKIHPSKIERIDVIKNVYMLGDYAFRGIVFIKSNTDNFAGFKFPDNSIFLDYQTITPYSEIEFPKYDSGDKLDDRSADFGNLMYWNPKIKDALNSGIQFYSNDHSSSYDVIVRGFTKNGEPIYGKSTFVNK